MYKSTDINLKVPENQKDFPHPARELELREKLSDLEHQQWECWSKELGKHLEEWKEDLPEEHNAVIEKINNRLARWETNWHPYNNLDEKTKDYDRKWADKSLEIFKQFLADKLNELEDKIDTQIEYEDDEDNERS